MEPLVQNEYYPAERQHAAPRHTGGRLPWLLLLLLGVIVLAYIPVMAGKIREAQMRSEVKVLRESLPDLKLKGLSQAFTLVYRKVKPSVVHIETTRMARVGADPLGGFFGRDRSFEEHGEASGVIVDSNGYILTNLHVVENASHIEVYLEDGRSFPATVIGVDPGLDLAVLKIDATGLIPITWGDSSQLEPAEMVWAIGNPYGLDQTVTSGIVSGIDRRGVGNSVYQRFLQTDVAINPGNSGGPLVDVEGNVVGINTAIFGRAFQGISFAIPSNEAQDVYAQIRKHGKIVRGYLGIGLAPLTAEMATKLRYPSDKAPGALVYSVTRESPAEKAGIESGDVIVEFNGQPVTDPNELTLMIARLKVGEEVPVKLIREGKEIAVNVKIAERPAQLR